MKTINGLPLRCTGLSLSCFVATPLVAVWQQVEWGRECEWGQESERGRRCTRGVFFLLMTGAAGPKLPQLCYYRFGGSRVGWVSVVLEKEGGKGAISLISEPRWCSGVGGGEGTPCPAWGLNSLDPSGTAAQWSLKDGQDLCLCCRIHQVDKKTRHWLTGESHLLWVPNCIWSSGYWETDGSPISPLIRWFHVEPCTCK